MMLRLTLFLRDGMLPAMLHNHSKGQKKHSGKYLRLLPVLLQCSVLFLLAGVVAQAQRTTLPVGGGSSPTPSNQGLGEGPIGAGDIVSISMYDAPDMSTQTTVSESGEIVLPVFGVYHIAGLTAREAASKMEDAYRERGIMRHPEIMITVQQTSAGVTVAGEVGIPGVYPITGRRRLIDAISQAGGVTQRAGHLIEITSVGEKVPREGVLWDPTLRDNASSANTLLRPGDTIFVSRCGVVYVNGNVTRPGAYPLCDSSHITLTQAVTLAQGIKPSTKYDETLLIRTEGNTRTMRYLRLNEILHGRAPDIEMQAEDILYVQPSWIKAGVKRTVELATAFASQAYLYFR